MKTTIAIILTVAILLLVPFDIVTFDTLVEVMVVLAIVFGLATIFYLSMCLIQSNYKDWKRKKKWGWSYENHRKEQVGAIKIVRVKDKRTASQSA